MKRFSFFPPVVFFFLIFLITQAYADSGPFNYYKPAPDRLLENVEKYHLGQGIEKTKKGKYEEAWNEFAFILNYFPNHPAALHFLSELSMQIKQPERSKKFFEKAVQLFPHDPPTHALYGVFMHKMGKPEDAVAHYEKAIKLDENQAEYRYNLGLAYLALKKYDLANSQAQLAYQYGYPLPGLREKLKSAGAWKPIG